MTQYTTEQLVFRPASELPTAELNGQEVLVLNPRDGWHEGTIYAFKDNGKVYYVGIYTSLMKELTPHDCYITWALLPDSIELGSKFKKSID